ncbi:hypothetical protein NJ7G_3113 [Natrinema sp. J7-2]|nr:hypothetical protein NJ7G_3113 [Natrinema sp. J7-2]
MTVRREPRPGSVPIRYRDHGGRVLLEEHNTVITWLSNYDRRTK